VADEFPSVGVTCSECGTKIIVMRPSLLEAIGKSFSPGAPVSELAFLEQLKTDKAVTGDRLAIADPERFYACPECGKRDRLPPDDELRRLEA
jgi:DNA-directed RNA polymerase subunit RPC12/RpoP